MAVGSAVAVGVGVDVGVGSTVAVGVDVAVDGVDVVVGSAVVVGIDVVVGVDVAVDVAGDDGVDALVSSGRPLQPARPPRRVSVTLLRSCRRVNRRSVIVQYLFAHLGTLLFLYSAVGAVFETATYR